MTKITLEADEQILAAARRRAASEHTTLDERFRQWLADYSQQLDAVRRYDETMASLRGKLVVGRKLWREEMNAR